MRQSNPEKSMRERMLAGEPYLASDPELVKMHLHAQQALQKFNSSPPGATQERHDRLKDLFGALGPNSEVKSTFRCDYGSHIFAGERLFINYDCVILDCNHVRIGDRVLIGPKVQIYTATHSLAPAVRKDGWEFALPIEIGSDVWIGGGVIVCPHVTIGDGSTIGAGSVVTRNIPPKVFAAGNPCRVIRSVGS